LPPAFIKARRTKAWKAQGYSTFLGKNPGLRQGDDIGIEI
jgi:hypothetical protein